MFVSRFQKTKTKNPYLPTLFFCYVTPIKPFFLKPKCSHMMELSLAVIRLDSISGSSFSILYHYTGTTLEEQPYIHLFTSDLQNSMVL